MTWVRASRLYDVEADESIPWDWTGEQPIPESQAAVEAAVCEVQE